MISTKNCKNILPPFKHKRKKGDGRGRTGYVDNGHAFYNLHFSKITSIFFPFFPCRRLREDHETEKTPDENY